MDTFPTADAALRAVVNLASVHVLVEVEPRRALHRIWRNGSWLGRAHKSESASRSKEWLHPPTYISSKTFDISTRWLIRTRQDILNQDKASKIRTCPDKIRTFGRFTYPQWIALVFRQIQSGKGKSLWTHGIPVVFSWQVCNGVSVWSFCYSAPIPSKVWGSTHQHMHWLTSSPGCYLMFRNWS